MISRSCLDSKCISAVNPILCKTAPSTSENCWTNLALWAPITWETIRLLERDLRPNHRNKLVRYRRQVVSNHSLNVLIVSLQQAVFCGTVHLQSLPHGVGNNDHNRLPDSKNKLIQPVCVYWEHNSCVVPTGCKLFARKDSSMSERVAANQIRDSVHTWFKSRVRISLGFRLLPHTVVLRMLSHHTGVSLLLHSGHLKREPGVGADVDQNLCPPKSKTEQTTDVRTWAWVAGGEPAWMAKPECVEVEILEFVQACMWS